jgi:hypothetical protein
MTLARLPAAIAVFALLSTTALAGGQKVVVELFTSQGCSSCPPADRLLGELAGDDSLVALSLPVDYWDYLGWHDTLAKAAYSQRQRGYSEQRGSSEVFTPQIIVNGVTQVVGSDRSAIKSACTRAASKVKPVAVTLKKNAGKVEVEVSGGSGTPAAVWLLSVAQEKPVMINRGENRGKTITYHNVVREFRKLADWNGAPVKQSIALNEIGDDADMVAVLVQPGSVEKPGPIRGAAALSLR